jgi:hypothetical protein
LTSWATLSISKNILHHGVGRQAYTALFNYNHPFFLLKN